MKKKGISRLVTLCFLIVVITGCGSGNNDSLETDKSGSTGGTGPSAESDAMAREYTFEHGNATIAMNMEATPILEALGREKERFESESCAFIGKDVIYYYEEFELHTYPWNDVDYINSIYITSDAISTMEGLKVGDSREDMVSTYGEDFKEEFDVYTFTKNSSKLLISIIDDRIDSIEYMAIPPKAALAVED